MRLTIFHTLSYFGPFFRTEERLAEAKATLERARHYGSMAKDALAIFRESKAKSALLDVVDFSTSRAN